MAETDYADFDFYLEKYENKYRARVLSSPAGQAVSEFELPFSPEGLENVILRLAHPRRRVRRLESIELGVAKQFGSKLFNALFNNEVTHGVVYGLG